VTVSRAWPPTSRDSTVATRRPRTAPIKSCLGERAGSTYFPQLFQPIAVAATTPARSAEDVHRTRIFIRAIAYFPCTRLASTYVSVNSNRKLQG
jgi:hypothetical protein